MTKDDKIIEVFERQLVAERHINELSQAKLLEARLEIQRKENSLNNYKQKYNDTIVIKKHTLRRMIQAQLSLFLLIIISSLIWFAIK